jgi:cobalamin biosynthesis protein CobD/CbiB
MNWLAQQLSERILDNWQETARGMAPALVILLGKFGLHWTAEQLLAAFTVTYFIIKALSKNPVTK